MCRSMFSMTTIASSTTRPVASVMPKSVSVLIEKPNSLTNANVPTSETGIVMAGNERRPPVLEEQEHDQNDEADRLEQRRHDLVDRFGDDARRVERELDLQPGRKVLGEPVELGADVPVDLQRVGGRQLRHAEADRVRAVVAKGGRVVLSAQLACGRRLSGARACRRRTV